MALESWLPFGYELPDGSVCGRPLHGAETWQIIETRGAGRALLVKKPLHDNWMQASLTQAGDLCRFDFGSQVLHAVSCGSSRRLAPLSALSSPSNRKEALAFANALRHTRSIDTACALQDAIYVESLALLLPTHAEGSPVPDDMLLGMWLTGGAHVSVQSFGRLQRLLTWIDARHLRDVVVAAGIEIDETGVEASKGSSANGSAAGRPGQAADPFRLFGRAGLEAFFQEHVIEIVQDKARYKALGIGFPSPTILHGPPGCGKTFAVDRLIDYLGWPRFRIEASTIASPYIHETSRKVSEMFDAAIKSAPSVLVIDEMEAFLAEREGGGGGHHRVEEVAEFLRRIPEATRNEVLVIGMTNRLDMIDAAIMRRGRFDHVISVDFPNEEEVGALLAHLLAGLPRSENLDTARLAEAMAGRPLSDVAFVVREGARLAARAGAAELGQEYLLSALAVTPSRQTTQAARRMGFI